MIAARLMVALILAGMAVTPAKAGHHRGVMESLVFLDSPVVSAVRPIDQQVFRTGVDLTTFGVVVTDRKGNLVTDLAKEDFEIVEDDKAQALQYFARGA